MLQYSLFDELILEMKLAERADPWWMRAEEAHGLAPHTSLRRGVADALVSIAMKLDRGAGEQLRAAGAATPGRGGL
jgi:hypothetical protein